MIGNVNGLNNLIHKSSVNITINYLNMSKWVKPNERVVNCK